MVMSFRMFVSLPVELRPNPNTLAHFVPSDPVEKSSLSRDRPLHLGGRLDPGA
jgi:hypothetical protein